MADIIDINIYPVIETVDLTIEPNLTTININTVTGGGGGAVSSVNTQTGDVVLTQDDVLDGTTYKQYSLTEKNKLAGIAAGAEVNVNADWNATTGDAQILNKPSIPAAQVNSDWNATSGVAQILNKPTIPSVTGYIPYTGATADLDLGTYNLNADHISLNVSPSGAGFVVGATEWNNTLGTSQTLLKGGNVTLKNGVDLLARVVNKVTPNTTLTKAAYQVVKVSGAQGQRLAVDLAQGNTDLNSADTLGIVIETIATNQEGFIITVGQIEDINTTGSLQGETWADGDVLYLSPTTAGRITNIKPNGSTGHIVVIGYVEYAHANNGKIYVKIMNGWELDELHNVYISSVANNQLLSYDSATLLWKNKSVTTADIADSTNKRYVTDANLTTIGNQSGTNTGDQDLTVKVDKLKSFNRQTASYTLVLADADKLVEMNVATANNLTIPLNSTVAYAVGTRIDIVQYGAGQTTFVPTSGVTIRSTNSWLKINARYGAATLTKVGTDEWYLWGNLNA